MLAHRFGLACLAALTLLAAVVASLEATVFPAPPSPAHPTPELPPLAPAFTAADGQLTIWVVPGPDAEVWTARAGEAPRLRLRAEAHHFSVPHWSPDGRWAAVLAVPTGSETAQVGRWWLIDLAQDTVTGPGPESPGWLHPPPGPPETGLEHARAAAISHPLWPPATIRVAHHPDNSCRSYLPAWTVTVVSFEEYVARVLPAEVYPSWPAAALQAQAIAARTFAWRKILLAPPDAPYDITDWAVDQVMCDARYPTTDAAVAATAGRYLAYGDEIILAQYSAENGHPTLDGGLPYLQPVLDPVSLGRPRSGHGHGLSQWGAYRWATWHGWNAVQILTHYYTGVRIFDPLGGDPSLSLLTPWPGSWLTGSAARLTAHAAFVPTASVTLTFQVPGALLADNDPADGWEALWPLDNSLSSPVTVSVSAEGFSHTLLLAGQDGLPPRGIFTLPSASPSPTVTLHISATDLGPSGLAGVAMGGDWQIAATEFKPEAGAGMLVPDADALSGSALRLPQGVLSRWAGELASPLAVDRIYQAYVRLRIAGGEGEGEQSLPMAGRVGRVELYDPAGNQLLGFADLHAADFRQPGTYQECPLDFWLAPEASGRLRVRVMATGALTLWLDRVRVLLGPQPFQPAMPYSLEHRAGPQPVVLKLLDAAGNPSDDLVATSELLDVTPPGEWQLLAPQGWVTTTASPAVVARVADDLSGIAAGSGEARISADAGVTWTPWQAVSMTVGPGLTAQLATTWPAGEGAGNQRIQFRVADVAGWRSFSPAWPVLVDLTPPHVHARLSAGPNAAGWITEPVTLTLWAEDAASGLAGLWYEYNGWHPYPGPLAFAGEGTFRIGYRAEDRAGLSSAVGWVSWQMDTLPPTAAVHAPRWAAAEIPFPVSWEGWDGVGVAGFDVQVSLDLGPWKEWLTRTEATEAFFLAPPAGTLRLRVRAYDLAGNSGPWSAPAYVSAGRSFVFLPLAR